MTVLQPSHRSKAVAVAKRMRAWPVSNELVRRGLVVVQGLARHSDWLAGRWRINGTPTVTLAGARFRMLGRGDDSVLDSVYYKRGWEAGETTLFAALLQDAEIVLDLGANTGVYSLLSTRISPTAQVVAVEPSPANADRLRANIALNAETRITVVEAAVGENEGTLELTVPADGSICDVASAVDAFSRAFYGIDYTTLSVVQTTVDRLVADHQINRLDLIKLDVEYFELSVLRGATKTLDTLSPMVMAEVFDYDVLTGNNPDLRGRIASDNGELIEKFMASRGYAFFAIGERGILRVPTLRGIPDGGSNYLFVKNPPERRYIPYADVAGMRSLRCDSR